MAARRGVFTVICNRWPVIGQQKINKGIILEHTPQEQTKSKINFFEVASQSWAYFTNYRLLWLLGFFSFLGFGSFGPDDFSFAHQFLYVPLLTDAPSSHWIQLLGNNKLAISLGVVLAIFLWLVHLVAQAGLIRSAVLLHDGKEIMPKQIIADGFKILGRMLILNLVFFGVFYIVAIASGWLVPKSSIFSQQYWNDLLTTDTGILWVSSRQIMSCILAPLNFLVVIIYPFAQREIVFQNNRLISSIRDSVRVLWQNMGRLISSRIGVLIIGAIALAGMSLLLSLFISLSGVGGILQDPSQVSFVVRLGAGLLISVVQAGLGALLFTFVSITVTLVYLDLEHQSQSDYYSSTS